MAAVQVTKNTADFQKQMNLHFSIFFFLEGIIFVCLFLE